MPEELNFEKLMGTLFSAADDDNYNERKVRRSIENGILVSTVLTNDEGYETAIGDENGVYPVERYGQNLEAAKKGHEKWLEQIKAGLDEIDALGAFGLDSLGEKGKKLVPMTGEQLELNREDCD